MSFFLQQSVNGVVLGSVFALYALGFSLVLANLKVFHVAHAAVFTWGAIFAWQLTDRLEFPLLLALPAAAVLSGVLNTISYFILIRHLERRRHKELAAFISSLGGLIVLAELAAMRLDRSDVRLPFDLFPVQTWRVGTVQLSSIQLLIVGVAITTFFVLRWLIDRTEIGREVTAVAFDRELANVLGVNADRVSMFVFFISGAIAGIGAVLVAIAFNVINSELGGAYMVLAIAVMVIGGFGRISGTFAGGLLVGLAAAYTTGYLTSSYREVVVYLLLLVFLVVRPSGLFPAPDLAGRA